MSFGIRDTPVIRPSFGTGQFLLQTRDQQQASFLFCFSQSLFWTCAQNALQSFPKFVGKYYEVYKQNVTQKLAKKIHLYLVSKALKIFLTKMNRNKNRCIPYDFHLYKGLRQKEKENNTQKDVFI